MSRVFIRIVLAFFVLAAASPVFAQIKVAVIDVNRVVTESDSGKESLQQLKALQDAKVEQGRALQQEVDSLTDQFTRQRLTLAADRLEQMTKQIEDKNIELKRFQDDAQRELDDARRRALGALEQRIMPLIDIVGKEMQLTLVFNKFQSGLVYADEAVDITDDVIVRFNTAQ
ncbi:MAG: OmpH family outer membrane protein [bacterium]|nr:OmpH family outer membrane protein [bacterium]